MRKTFNGVYEGKKVLITGHTGFKGSWLSIWLESLGAEVIGYALPAPTKPSLFEVAGLAAHITSIEDDIRDVKKLERVLEKHEPDMVFHLAAQSLVRQSYAFPKLTYETNIMGTVNLLEAVRKSNSVRVCTVITSDKCYDNKEWVYAYRENDALGGYDPYSSSKAGAELVVGSYQQSFFNPDKYESHGVALASARAGNVIGGGDWSSDRIVPDAVRALADNKIIIVRNPRAVRPWQHVFEPLSGYLWLAALMWDQGAKYSSAWNFGPNNVDNLTVGQLVEGIVKKWGSGEWTDVSGNSSRQLHEANILRLDCTKSQSVLGWSPVYGIDEAINATVDWYRNYYYKPDSSSYDFTLTQIQAYVDRAKDTGLSWAGGYDNNNY
jgi:CDP-glucose 4,6-dehydratase